MKESGARKSWGKVRPRGHLAMSGDISGCHMGGGATDISWVENRDASQHPTQPRAALTTKNYPALNANSGDTSLMEKACWSCCESPGLPALGFLVMGRK